MNSRTTARTTVDEKLAVNPAMQKEIDEEINEHQWTKDTA